MVLHGLGSHSLHALVQDFFEVVVQSSGLAEDLEQQLQEDASFRILYGDVALSAEHGECAHLNEQDQEGFVVDESLSAMDEELVESVHQIAE